MSAPKKLADRRVRFGGQGEMQFTSPRWDWETWSNSILVTVRPNYHGVEGASLLSAKNCRALAAELLRRADDLDDQRIFALSLGVEGQG